MGEGLPDARSTSERAADILEAGLDQFEAVLPPGWALERRPEAVRQASPARADGVFMLKAPGQYAPAILVEAHTSFAPRDVEGVLGGRREILRQVSGATPVVIIAPALSERSRALLSEQGYGYADLGGNVRLVLETPGLFIDRLTSNPPIRTRQSRATLRGEKAGRIVRVLADVSPPYGVLDLAKAADVTPGYMSKLLEYLDREALIDRARRGVVTSVDWRELLRRRAEYYGVFTSNQLQFYVARQGPAVAREHMRDHNYGGACLTGSFLAMEFAPIATPGMLVMYVQGNSSEIVAALDLLPADDGANVALVRPGDPFVLLRQRRRELLNGREPYVRRPTPAVSCAQAVLDCLTGNGRMPAEGEALMGWMAEHEPRWRIPSLDDVAPWEAVA